MSKIIITKDMSQAQRIAAIKKAAKITDNRSTFY